MRIRRRDMPFVLLGAGALVACGRGPARSAVRGFPNDALDSLAVRESVLRSTPDTARLREYVRTMSEEPHHSGSPGARAVAEWGLGKFREFGLAAEMVEYQALLPFPVSTSVEMTAPTHFRAKMQEPVLKEDKDCCDKNQLPVWLAYSPDGDVEGELVYANFGNAEDYALLDSLGIDLHGKIVIVRYSVGVRSAKIKQAAERGAKGCIIYSDPKEDGFGRGAVYPEGPWRPVDAVQRGTAADYAAMYPGDPLTPGWASKPGARQLSRSQAKSLPAIPVVPLSYGDAKPLLETLEGPESPRASWTGGLPITYRIGPGPTRVRVRVKSEWKVRPIYDVIARIPGAVEPDQWVILANHHDGWVHGARDPVSAASALLEAARSFSALLKTGWRPARTLVFGLWDGEEWGLLGSTEWVEDHADELREKAVAYFNTDGYGAGRYGASGSHTLETFMREAARDLKDPATGLSAIDAARDRALKGARSAADSAAARARRFELGTAGSGSDFEPFLEHAGIATLSHSFSAEYGAGVYHSIYDSYDYFSKFVDPGYVYGAAQAGADAVLALRMADAPVLPFSFADAAAAYRRFAQDVVRRADARLGANRLDAAPLLLAIDRLAKAGATFDASYGRTLARGDAFLAGAREPLRAINKDLYQSERDLLDDAGLPGREWFRSTMYATGVYMGFAPDPMPGVSQMVNAGKAAEAQDQLRRVAAAVDRMAVRAERVTLALEALTR